MTKPVMFATAKLIPLRLRSRGNPGRSRGYPEAYHSDFIASALEAIGVARTFPIEIHTDDTGKAAWEGGYSISLAGGNQDCAVFGGVPDQLGESFGVRGVSGTEAQIDHLSSLGDGPFDGVKNRVDAGAEAFVENPDCQIFGIGGFFLDRGHDGGAVA